MTSKQSSSPLIVVVDDDDEVRGSLGLVLKRWIGCSVEDFPCGRMALAGLRERPQLAVLDVDMVPMSGLEVAAALRDRWPNLPIVFLTGCGPDAREALRSVSPHAVLQKPVPLPTLVETVQKASGLAAVRA